MLDIKAKEQLSKITSINGIDIYSIKTKKFKTNTINIFFHDNLRKESASKNALLPAVLRRGCEAFPTLQDIALYQEELYGASFDCGVTKKGERHIIQFYIDCVSDKYTGNNTNLFEKTFDLLFEIIAKPVLENAMFKTEYVEQEKINIKNIIEGRVNDKVQYAVEKCLEEMCKDEPFGIYEYGSVEELMAVDAKSLYDHYKDMLETFPVSVYLTGDIDESMINKVVDRLSTIKRGKIKNVDITGVEREVPETRNIEEKMSINQGKLSLGFRTNTSSGDRDYFPLVVYNGILGGGIHSKLFQNVREKASLAYYVFSRLERFKGLMVISSGIESGNKDKAMKIILQQMDEIKRGNISDYEYDSTIKTIETGMRSLMDSQFQMVDFYLSQSIVNANDDFESMIEKFKKVKKEDVIRISDKIKLDTVYFLTGNDHSVIDSTKGEM